MSILGTSTYRLFIVWACSLVFVLFLLDCNLLLPEFSILYKGAKKRSKQEKSELDEWKKNSFKKGILYIIYICNHTKFLMDIEIKPEFEGANYVI